MIATGGLGPTLPMLLLWCVAGGELLAAQRLGPSTVVLTFRIGPAAITVYVITSTSRARA